MYNRRMSQPGASMGLTTDEVKKMNNRLLKRKGFFVTVAATVLSSTQITLIGGATFLEGLVITMEDTTVNGGVTLNVDGDTVIDNVSYAHLTRDAARSSYNKDYYPIGKFIAGTNSSIKLDMTMSGATNAWITFFYFAKNTAEN